MTKEQAIKLIDCQKQLNTNTLPKELIDECYKLIPNVIPDTFLRIKVQEIQKYLTFNMDVISQALKEQDVVETLVVEKYDVTPVKARRKPQIRKKKNTKQ